MQYLILLNVHINHLVKHIIWIYDLCFCIDSFKDKVVWITGASSGIGEQIALNLSKFGAKLVLSARSNDKLFQVKNRCIGNFLKKNWIKNV